MWKVRFNKMSKKMFSTMNRQKKKWDSRPKRHVQKNRNQYEKKNKQIVEISYH